MKKMTCFVAFAALSTFVIVHSAWSLSGYVRYQRGRKPASYAMLIFEKHKREISRVMTDDRGFYFIKLPVGNNGVKIKHKNKSKNERLKIRSREDRHDFSL